MENKSNEIKLHWWKWALYSSFSTPNNSCEIQNVEAAFKRCVPLGVRNAREHQLVLVIFDKQQG